MGAGSHPFTAAGGRFTPPGGAAAKTTQRTTPGRKEGTTRGRDGPATGEGPPMRSSCASLRMKARSPEGDRPDQHPNGGSSDRAADQERRRPKPTSSGGRQGGPAGPIGKAPTPARGRSPTEWAQYGARQLPADLQQPGNRAPAGPDGGAPRRPGRAAAATTTRSQRAGTTESLEVTAAPPWRGV